MVGRSLFGGDVDYDDERRVRAHVCVCMTRGVVCYALMQMRAIYVGRHKWECVCVFRTSGFWFLVFGPRKGDMNNMAWRLTWKTHTRSLSCV